MKSFQQIGSAKQGNEEGQRSAVNRKMSMSSGVNINPTLSQTINPTQPLISNSNEILSPISYSKPIPSNQPPKHSLKDSQLSTSISSLTYGLSCLIYQLQSSRLYQCLMMIHEQYINILHLIINRSKSYLLKLNDLKYITDQDTFIAERLAANSNIEQQLKQNYIVLTLNSLKNIVFVFKTENQKQIILLGLKFFFNQAKSFYNKLSQYDPFKAQSIMLFLQADKDGGNLLDIQEITNILNQLKINKEKIDIEADVLEINKALYERQNLKRPKNASSNQLTPIAFQYLLRYYSIKQQLAKYFKEYCPMFKTKSKNHKNSIIDIIKNNQKPIMSGSQLKNFYYQILHQTDKTQAQLEQIIQQFPVYDGQGKEKFDLAGDQTLLSFDNFCNLIFSKQNSLIKLIDSQQKSLENQELLIHKSVLKKKKQFSDYSLLDYYVYSDLSFKNSKRKEKTNFFTLALKRGVKCINLVLDVSVSKQSKGNIQNSNKKPGSLQTAKLSTLVIKFDEKQQVLLDNILKDVKSYAFSKNKHPFFIVFDVYSIFSEPNHVQYFQLMNQVIQDSLGKQCIFIYNGSKDQKRTILPNLRQLQGKFILVSNFNQKMTQKQQKNQNHEIPLNLSKKLSFGAVKLDYERKGQTCWNSCFIQRDKLKDYESAQQQNLSNYSKKLLIFEVLKTSINARYDSFVCFRQGIQFIGQNFETDKQNNYLIHSKFSEISQSHFGYLLKPAYMHTQNNAPLYTNKDFTKQLPTKIKFNVLSGQKLILNDIEYTTFYIEVTAKGNYCDEQNNKIFKSQKKTQGFYTQINLECQFMVYNEELFTIFIVIKTSENHKIISGRSVSLKNMREGLRTLEMFNERMQTKQNSYLLIHFTRQQLLLKDQRANKMQQFLK